MDKKLFKLAETSLKILNKKNLESISVDEIILKSKIKNSKLTKISSKLDLLINLNRYFDFRIIKESKHLENSTSKDMIFEIIMMRFDLLQENRKSIINIFKSFKKNPQNLVFLLPSFVESIIVMARMAKISVSGIRGRLRVKSLLVVYFSSFLIWLKDSSDSLEKTMNALNIYLDRSEKLMSVFNK